MKNIYLIVGPSGVGKTTIVNELSIRYDLSVLKSYTDRPPRAQNEPGHTFISPEEFDQLPAPVLAYVEYDGFRYGTTQALVDEADIYVVEPSGVLEILALYKGMKGVKVIGLTHEPNELFKRMVKRGESRANAKRRLVADAIVFRNFTQLCDTVIKNWQNEATVNAIASFINNCEQESMHADSLPKQSHFLRS